jgi:hypothetical protein
VALACADAIVWIRRSIILDGILIRGGVTRQVPRDVRNGLQFTPKAANARVLPSIPFRM